MAEVRLGDAAPALAAAGVPIAHAEGFPAHAASMVCAVAPADACATCSPSQTRLTPRLRQNPRP